MQYNFSYHTALIKAKVCQIACESHHEAFATPIVPPDDINLSWLRAANEQIVESSKCASLNYGVTCGTKQGEQSWLKMSQSSI